MFKQALPLAMLLALAACEGSSPNPVNGTRPPDDTTDPGDGGGEVVDNAIPEALALNVTGIGIDKGDPADPDDDVLTVEGIGLDDSPFTARYRRNAALDVDGYQAFSSQSDRLDRMYVAVSAEGPNGEVRAGSISDGGQVNRFFRGNFYERLVPLTRPSVSDGNGQVSYAGFYAGVTNLSDLDQDQRLPPRPGDPPEALPSQPRQTTGKVFLNVDFADNKVNGTIYDREFTDGKQLDSLALIETDLDDNGEWIGEVEFAGRPDLGKQGDHGGILGGTNASAAAGVIQLDNLFDPDEDDPDDGTFDREVGTFVLPRCGTPAAPDICDGLGDLE
jgi:hypothetical protein